jgi:D-glycero-D-manno-heptose 1,7-bisphosphate phosphatase
MNKAVFIDRDGVINIDEGLYYIYKITDFKVNNYIIENLQRLKKAGYLIIVISNQGGIGKKLYTKNDTDHLHALLQTKFKEHGFVIDEFYFCPHHPESGNCICRKPDSLLFEKAIARFDINAGTSYAIGDSPRDIEAAQKTGLKGILVLKNSDITEQIHAIINSNDNSQPS